MQPSDSSSSNLDDTAYAIEELNVTGPGGSGSLAESLVGEPPVSSTPAVDLDRPAFEMVADTSVGGTVFVSEPPRMGRKLRGYDRNEVDDYIAHLHREGRRLMQELITLRERHTRAEAEIQLSRRELAWWRAQRETLDIAVAKAHSRAVDIEQRANERATGIEQDARQTAERLISEARQQGREVLHDAESKAAAKLREAESQVHAEQARAAELAQTQVMLARNVREAMRRFESGIDTIESVQDELGNLGASLDSPAPEAPATPGDMDEPAQLTRKFQPPTENGSTSTSAEPASADAGSESVANTASDVAKAKPGTGSNGSAAGVAHGDQSSAITLEVAPVTSFAGLTAVQQALADIDGIDDVFVRSFSSDTARLQFSADAGLALGEVIPASLPWACEVEDDGDRPVLRLTGGAVSQAEVAGA